MTCQVLLYGHQHVLGAEFSFHGLYTFLDFVSFWGSPCRSIKLEFWCIPISSDIM